MKTILVLIRDDSGQEARLQAAITIARKTSTGIICLDVDEHQDLAVRGDPIGLGSHALQDVVLRQKSANRRRVDAILADAGMEVEWRDSHGPVRRAMADEAMFADLVILNTQPQTYSFRDGSFVVADVVAANRGPVLLVPDDSARPNFGRSAAVAWDGSATSAAALRAALPMLRLSPAVTLLQASKAGGGAPIERALHYLRAHQLEVRVRVEERVRDVAGWLDEQCAPDAVDFCVMGAFGRSRRMEAVFGGVTLSMLNRSRVPLLVAQ